MTAIHQIVFLYDGADDDNDDSFDSRGVLWHQLFFSFSLSFFCVLSQVPLLVLLYVYKCASLLRSWLMFSTLFALSFIFLSIWVAGPSWS